ncbi:hypothetical protein A3C23_01850 [Candidatus Roizmanbacteria bacterium RIFCSPHIGHO2_02_FULL_37_13b]|uniref:SCP domain-containing protein n=1 Tax=Candidatus Roizmanbacteria bacterium RIFCSPLOWO2_02_FULL_36_11 TaxID=1802071 RepID=A0A1F7JBL3_9BACT|nr:MAG: hypothetical protein A3C23_01850 [Candidatus Roizmanbacteria bacterium RIFCSPHIGHO2_02_FULL_37_13b]OGK52996.1 MAG: hypothetical protein A3H78_02170 [Candidatus Roizmanbacteria bacterium RIFCSPLOWO2_02_FULL_36_11]
MNNLLHHLFIPSENNNYRSKLLHLDFLSLYLAVIMFISIAYRLLPLPNILGLSADQSTDKYYQLTNQRRIENGLATLTFNAALSSAAVNKANDMFASGYWAHFNPQNNKSPWDFIRGAGYSYSLAGENLAKNFSDAEATVNAWMNSTSHRDNILKASYADVGFGIVNGKFNGDETTIVVQMFGTPLKGKAIAAKPVEAAEKTVTFLKPTTIPTNIPTNVPSPIATITEGLDVTPTSTTPATKYDIVAGSRPTDKTARILGQLTFNTSHLFILILIIALILDFYYAYKLNVVRLTGRHLAHFIFLGIIFISLFILKKGAIL